MIGRDKVLHAIAGALVFLIAWVLLDSGPAALGVVLAVGAGKELYDLAHRDRHTPSWADLAATVAPAVVLWFVVGLVLDVDSARAVGGPELAQGQHAAQLAA